MKVVQAKEVKDGLLSFWFTDSIKLAKAILHNMGSWGQHRLGLLNFSVVCSGKQNNQVLRSVPLHQHGHIIWCKGIVFGFVVLGQARCCSPGKGDNFLSDRVTPKNEIGSERCAVHARTGLCLKVLTVLARLPVRAHNKGFCRFRGKALSLNKTFSYSKRSKTLHNKRKQVQSNQCTHVDVALQAWQDANIQTSQRKTSRLEQSERRVFNLATRRPQWRLALRLLGPDLWPTCSVSSPTCCANCFTARKRLPFNPVATASRTANTFVLGMHPRAAHNCLCGSESQ